MSATAEVPKDRKCNLYTHYIAMWDDGNNIRADRPASELNDMLTTLVAETDATKVNGQGNQIQPKVEEEHSSHEEIDEEEELPPEEPSTLDQIEMMWETPYVYNFLTRFGFAFDYEKPLSIEVS